jgi:hypothetical protein
MPGKQISWVLDFFILEDPITFCSYLLWVQEDGRTAMIVYPVNRKNMYCSVLFTNQPLL